MEPSRDTEAEAAGLAAGLGHTDILTYCVEERKIPGAVKIACVTVAARDGQLDCIKYLVEDAKAPLNHWLSAAYARYFEHSDCLNYFLEKGCPERRTNNALQLLKSSPSNRTAVTEKRYALD